MLLLLHDTAVNVLDIDSMLFYKITDTFRNLCELYNYSLQKQCTCYRYDPDEDHWVSVEPMHCKRLGVGVAVINRLLYAVGGYDGERRLKSVECYNPELNKWTYVADMNHPRSGAGG